MKTPQQKRAIELLRIARRYLTENEIQGSQYFEVHYDGADCDGYCLADDLEIAANDLEDEFST